MRLLWLTLADPEPRHNGQYIYSGGLIDAVAASGARIEVVGLARCGDKSQFGRRNGAVHWWLAKPRPRPDWTSLLSPLPHVADIGWTPELRRILDRRLEAGPWDAIVFDGMSAGWGLKQVLRRCGNKRRPKLVYISHNHETSVRHGIAQGYQGALKRQALRLDATKVRMLERAMLDASDLVTTITPEDRDSYLRERPSCRIEVITPGYGGDRLAERRISADLPRRAIIVGSFHWIAKRMNVADFVAIADPLFVTRNADLQVVGSADEAFLQSLRRDVKATHFTGTVKDVESYMRQARIALVPERHGGGFKLKVLEYVFNRIPILALRGSVAGMPLEHEKSILFYPDHEAMARGALEILDDCDRLNALQERAFDACKDSFEWRSRGEQLVSAIGAL